jgi:cytochrome c2
MRRYVDLVPNPRCQHSWLSLRFIFAAVLCSLIVAPAAALGQTAELAIPNNPLRGRLLFEEKSCYECHQFRGEGTGPDLVGGNFSGSFLDLGASLWNHVPGMTVQHELHEVSWPTLSADQVVELLSFLYYLDYLGRPGDAGRGRSLFRDEGCSTCHAARGNQSPVGPSLVELTRFASPLYVAQAIWNHGPNMLRSLKERQMAPPQFQEGDLADIAAHLRQPDQSRPQERLLLAPGDPNHGRRLFVDKGCANCHDDERGTEAPDLIGADLHRSAEALAGNMWNHALEMNEAMQQSGIEWPSFTTSELADLIAYLYFLPFIDPVGDPARGKLVFVSRACADCHGGRQQSSHPGPELTGEKVAGSPAAMVAAMWNHAPMMKEVILEEGRPWPRLTGTDLRDLLAYLRQPQ